MSTTEDRTRPATALVDLDGTLVDTNHLHAVAWARAMRSHGYEATFAGVHHMIGAGSSVLMEELMGTEDEAVKSEWRSQIETLTADFVPLPGAIDLVQRLKHEGVCVVLATSSPPDLVEHHLDALGLDADDLDAITTDGDVEEAKPEPDVFTTAMDAVGADPERTVVVGDSVWDVHAAGRARLRTIALTCGGTDRRRLLEAGAMAVYEDPAHLVTNLADSPLGRLLVD